MLQTVCICDNCKKEEKVTGNNSFPPLWVTIRRQPDENYENIVPDANFCSAECMKEFIKNHIA
jgi:hypothetical protein